MKTKNLDLVNGWIDALRSGEYEQVTGQLRRGDEHCCLGVACDIWGKGEWTDRYRFDTNGNLKYQLNARFDYVHNGKPNLTALPELLQYELGLSDFEQQTLAELNDSYEMPFTVIADFIEWLRDGGNAEDLPPAANERVDDSAYLTSTLAARRWLVHYEPKKVKS